MSDPQELVCVYNATNATKAELVRTLLESEGIRAVTGDTSNPFPGLSIAPAEVFVQRTDEVAALAIVASINERDIQDQADVEDEADVQLHDTDVEIPTQSFES